MTLSTCLRAEDSVIRDWKKKTSTERLTRTEAKKCEGRILKISKWRSHGSESQTEPFHLFRPFKMGKTKTRALSKEQPNRQWSMTILFFFVSPLRLRLRLYFQFDWKYMCVLAFNSCISFSNARVVPHMIYHFVIIGKKSNYVIRLFET